MPLMRCEIDGGPGWKWGESGKCYGYTAGEEASEQEARKKAMAQAAAMGEFPGTGSEARSAELPAPHGQVEFREAVVTEVDVKKRLIDLIIVPYEQESATPVEFRGQLWREVHTRGAYDGIENHAGRVAMRRGHFGDHVIGKMVQFVSHESGLIGRGRIAPTPLGDETLVLAEEDCLSPSVGFTVRGRDQILDRRTMLRRINRAFVDHVAMVEQPAYEGARVLAVREGLRAQPAVNEPLATPILDQYQADEMFAWASQRASRPQ